MSKRFEEKVVLVTGASRGIGKEIAVRFAAEGAKVICVSRKPAALEEVAGEIAETGGDAFPMSCHVGRIDEFPKLAEDVKKKFGRLDVLVNNAGTNPVFGPSMFVEEAAFDKIFEVNLKGPFFLSKAFLPMFQEQGEGAVINVVSTAAFSPMQGLGIYSVSKSALTALGKLLAKEWAPFGVRVNNLAPGLVKTRFSRALWDSEEILGQAIDRQAIKRLAEPEDIAGAALFLASKDAAFMTGQTIIVDGGSLI